MKRRIWKNISLCLALCGGASRVAVAEPLPEAILSTDPAFAIPLQIEADSQIAEVRLYVSGDGGKNWRVEGRKKPPVANFEFRAPADGEYWFLVRTVDAAGQESPGDAMTPEMRVIVDSQPPRLELTSAARSGGEIVADWKADDSRLDARSLKWSYRSTGEGPWLPLQPSRTKQNGNEGQASGQIAFVDPSGGGSWELRLEVADAAGNKASRQTQIVTTTVARSPTSTPTSVTSPNTKSPDPVAFGASSASTAPPMPVRDPLRPLMVNSLSFELEYEVDRLPASAVGKVEIWGTRDNGRTWNLLGLDDDRQSPCVVTVDREGLYGFSIVVDAPGASGIAPPKAGDQPEIRVGVDLKNPQVKLTTAEPDPEGRPASLKINWSATDEHLGPQAVSLAYSDSPKGPWLPLAVGVPNDGGRVCRFDANCPEKVYLRIEVRDDAGNLGAFSTTLPVPIEKRSFQIQFAGASRENDRAKAPKWFHVLR